MRKIYFLFAMIVLTGNCLAADDSRIAAIREEYKTIRSQLPGMSTKVIDLDDYSADGGGGKYYTDKAGNIRFIRVEFYGESGKDFEEFYYKDSKLIFAFRQRFEYNVPYYVTSDIAKESGGEVFDEKKTKVLEDRFYYDKGLLIRWINSENKKVDPQSMDAIKAGKEMLDFAREIKAKYNLPAQ